MQVLAMPFLIVCATLAVVMTLALVRDAINRCTELYRQRGIDRLRALCQHPRQTTSVLGLYRGVWKCMDCGAPIIHTTIRTR